MLVLCVGSFLIEIYIDCLGVAIYKVKRWKLYIPQCEIILVLRENWNEIVIYKDQKVTADRVSRMTRKFWRKSYSYVYLRKNMKLIERAYCYLSLFFNIVIILQEVMNCWVFQFWQEGGKSPLYPLALSDYHLWQHYQFEKRTDFHAHLRPHID